MFGPGALCVGPKRSLTPCRNPALSVSVSSALRAWVCFSLAVCVGPGPQLRSVCRSSRRCGPSSASALAPFVPVAQRVQLRSVLIPSAGPSSHPALPLRSAWSVVTLPAPPACHPSVRPHPAMSRAAPRAPSSDPCATRPARRVPFFQERTPNITAWGEKSFCFSCFSDDCSDYLSYMLSRGLCLSLYLYAIRWSTPLRSSFGWAAGRSRSSRDPAWRLPGQRVRCPTMRSYTGGPFSRCPEKKRPAN